MDDARGPRGIRLNESSQSPVRPSVSEAKFNSLSRIEKSAGHWQGGGKKPYCSVDWKIDTVEIGTG